MLPAGAIGDGGLTEQQGSPKAAEGVAGLVYEEDTEEDRPPVPPRIKFEAQIMVKGGERKIEAMA